MGRVAIVLLLALSLPVLPAAGQATITVNKAADNTIAGNGNCTLREAITNANSNSDTTGGDCTAGVGATDTIEFIIGGGGSLATIQPTSQLPTITEGVTIDGTTQGCAGSGPCIELDGTSAGFAVDGLVITGSSSTIRGLVINRFDGDGVEVTGAGATGNTVAGNYIGTDAAGTAALGNGHQGVLILAGASNNMIGGTVAGARNVISGNNVGVRISDIAGSGTQGNQVEGNYIGTDVTGAAALGNSSNGVQIGIGGSNNMIGGTAAGAGNVISGNGIHGVLIDTSDNNTVAGNFIGTDANGTAALGNSHQGVLILGSGSASSNTIGGTAAGARNVISGNNVGVRISSPGTQGNQVEGNYIGTDVTGTAALGNSTQGVVILGGASNNTIGGTAAGAGNVISGNEAEGVLIRLSGTSGNQVQGNLIGTDANGTAALGNTLHGVLLEADATSNMIGGTAAGAGNVISGNDESGVRIDASDNNTVAGNLIGTDANGTTDLGNTGHGVSIEGGATSNTVGGTADGAGNVVSGNNANGVRIVASPANVVAGNLIGTDVTGTADLGNTLHGVLIEADATSNMIGGTVTGAGNVVSGNDLTGLIIHASDDNTVAGNLIGTDANGTADLGNTGHGVSIEGGATSNTVGGTADGAGNTIAFNANDGIAVTGTGSTGNAFHANAMFQNGDLGIDLGDDGPTPNDPGDGDGSPNMLQNFPALTSAAIDGNGDLIITYLVDTDPAKVLYDLVAEFFEADVDSEEGQTFLGSDTYTATDYNGCGLEPCEKTINLGGGAGLGVSPGDRLVATATDDASNTSELSPSAVVSPVTRYVATTGSDTGGNDCTNPLAKCATLTHAVGQANAGDTIDLDAGTYTEPGLVIDKALHIQGLGVVVR